ncbi:MAG: hypothetical protein ISR69_08105 [Gammaproteobacteria bacterium]|nr:hypothetical protein [Gammaproteobacteria bacterium]
MSIINNVPRRPVLLVILDGFGVNPSKRNNAVLEADETLDKEAGKLLDVAYKLGYSTILTADHGNCEELIDPFSGEPHTQHTTYPVPCLVVDEVNWRLSTSGGLSNIAPTVLELMGLKKPDEMTSRSLLLNQIPGERPKALRQVELRGAA